MTTQSQLTLLRPEWFRPVFGSDYHYVPVLQTKPGELEALANAAEETWAHMTPLIMMLGPKRRESKPFKRQRVANWVKKVGEAVGSHPFFMDILRFRSGDSVQATKGASTVLEEIYSSARKQGLNFVPVLQMNFRAIQVARVREAVECDGRGVAVRYRILDSASADGRSAETLVKEMLGAVGVDAVGADLLIDLGFIDPDIEIDSEDLDVAVGDLLSVGDWRSVVLLGTSMHRSLGGGIVPEGTVGRLPRREWELWKALRSRRPRRLPTFGDYAVQHPDPPWEGEESGPGMRANVRYTLENVTVVPRGIGPLQLEGAEQYRRLCAAILAEASYSGRSYTWGDRLIQDCANGGGEPGNQNRWRGAGTSHHLRFVVDQLAALN